MLFIFHKLKIKMVMNNTLLRKIILSKNISTIYNLWTNEIISTRQRTLLIRKDPWNCRLNWIQRKTRMDSEIENRFMILGSAPIGRFSSSSQFVFPYWCRICYLERHDLRILYKRFSLILVGHVWKFYVMIQEKIHD